jgi:predicted aspartyl protease
MKRKLSRAFHPPAPLVPVALRAPGGVDALRLDGKIDTGADVCAVPEHVVAELDLPPVRTVRAAGFAGALQEAIVYRVDVELDGVTYRRLEALSTRRPSAIVGRNLLQSVVLRVHGPREELAIDRPRRR